MVFNFQSLARAARTALRLLASPERRPGPGTRAGKVAGPSPAVRRPDNSAKPPVTRQQEGLPSAYPGDYPAEAGPLRLRYSPSPDGNPDPGEVVWTWVPYEEDFTRGKDRPVLIVGAAGRYLLALMLTSKDHDGGGASSADYVDVGSGAWDRQGRPSEVKLDRILQIRQSDVRREGAVLGKAGFQAVAAALSERNGWPAPRP